MIVYYLFIIYLKIINYCLWYLRANNTHNNQKGDWAVGGRGNDTIHGGTNKDFLQGGADSDTVYGGGGDDVILGDGHVRFNQRSKTVGFRG